MHRLTHDCRTRLVAFLWAGAGVRKRRVWGLLGVGDPGGVAQRGDEVANGDAWMGRQIHGEALEPGRGALGVACQEEG